MAAPEGSTTAAPPVPTHKFKLNKESELRVEVGWNFPIRVQLISGSAEIFGSELVISNWISFPIAQKFAIFTWNEALVELEGDYEVAYTADETPMVSYVNCHAVLERRRQYAKEYSSRASSSPSSPILNQQHNIPSDSYGPRVMVVGPSDSGKSSLVKMLLGWAARQGWKPIFVELDVGQGAITVPGTIAATPIEMPIDPTEGVPMTMSLVHFYGHTSPSINTDLYQTLMKELARNLESQTSTNAEVRASGMIINTMGWVEGTGLELLLKTVEAFNASVILVIGQEKLYSSLQAVLKGRQGIDVVKLHKSGGVISRNTKLRQRTRMQKIREYFYGIFNELSPFTSTFSFNDVQIFRIGSALASRKSRVPATGVLVVGAPVADAPVVDAPVAATPVASDAFVDPTRVSLVTISKELVHCVLAVSYAKDGEHLLTSNVAGFLHVIDIDMARRKISFMAPCPGPLPNNILIVGSMTWVE